MKDIRILALIPARGGSKRIPRKNIRFLAGKPLIHYAIENSLNSRFIDEVYVSTDDEEIRHFSKMAGARVIKRPSSLAGDDSTLDPVIFHAVTKIERKDNVTFDYVLTLQPTSPLLSTYTIDKAIKKIIENQSDTLLSVVDNRCLSWTKKRGKYVPNYKERKNRQYLPPNYLETGGILISKRDNISHNNRIGHKIELLEIPEKEAIDIDTEMDWWVVEKLLNLKRILIRAIGSKKVGLGHVYRVLLLANRLIDHELLFVTCSKYELARELIENNNYKIELFKNENEFKSIIDNYKPHIVFNDILDTTSEYIKFLKDRDIFVCNFEDIGSGAKHADIVINALYEDKFPMPNHFCGSDYFCLREEFYLYKKKEINKDVNEILITFGGTDERNYSERIVKIINSLDISKLKKIIIILGLGYDKLESLQKVTKESEIEIEVLKTIKNISKYMYKADVIFTSAGRTVYEIASIGTPTIVLAQNIRELRHNFAHAKNGFINLKLGYEITDREISETLLELVNNYDLRKKCNKLMLKNQLKSGVSNIIQTIFKKYKEKLEERA